MIYYTNIGTIAPDNSYLVFNAEGSILGQLSSSFVANLRNGDVILLGGSTYRVTNIQGTRVNVTTVTGYRPTVPSWSGEARGRSRELSKALLDLIGHTVNALRKQFDPLLILKDVYGLSEGVANTIARHLQEHTLDSFQVPDPNRIIIEEVVSGGMPTYMITSCRGRDSIQHLVTSWLDWQNNLASLFWNYRLMKMDCFSRQVNRLTPLRCWMHSVPTITSRLLKDT